MSFVIDRMNSHDWDKVRAIYLAGLSTGHASFETSAPTWEKWDAKYLPDFRFVARGDKVITGWAALTSVSDRCVYAGVAEVSVYVAAEASGHGVGSALLRELIAASERGGYWTLQAGIFPDNAASIALHRKCGFREVGRRERLGKRDGVWRLSLLFERRSNVVGVD